MNKIIPYSKQSIDSSDIKSVVKVLKSSHLAQGPEVIKFEKKLSNFVKANYAVSFNSGSSALHAACYALNVKKNDIVWTSPISFVASANCALYCGAKINFIDIDINTFNLDVDALEKKLKISKAPKVLIPVHLAGNPCDMQKIYHLSKKYNFKIIEDASHALGSEYQKKKIGSCKFSHITVFSFHPVKTITTGEGGAAVCNNYKVYNKLKSFSSHGIVKKLKNEVLVNDQKFLGYNYRLNEMSGALGISQLKKIDQYVKFRNKIARLYINKIKKEKLNINIQQITKNSKSSYHLFIIRVKNKVKLLKQFTKNNFYTPTHYMPIYKNSFYKKFKFDKKNFFNSEKYYKEAISLPIFYGIKFKNIEKIIKIIKKNEKC